MPWVGYLAVGIGGVLVGWLIAAILIRRIDGQRSDPTQTPSALAAQVMAEADTGYLVTDDDGNLLLANRRARELEVLRAGMADPRIAEAIERVVISGEPVDVDLDSADASGTQGPASFVRAEVSRLGDGLILASAVDESAARRVEAIRRDFVANVSHELKTPVGAIALLAEAVLDGADDPESVRHFAGRMLAESTRLGTLVTELIALSRLQGGFRLTDAPVVEVDAVVTEAVGRLTTTADAAGIAVTTDAASGLLVRGDRTLLVTALANLIDNAVSYSPAGTAVSITRSATDEMVDIAVTDRGIGIAAEHRTRVFERFFRVDPARSRDTGGTGLGLAIVKHVAANHGGAALLWSRPGTGSTFTLRLPQVHSTAENPAESPHPAAAAVAPDTAPTAGAPAAATTLDPAPTTVAGRGETAP